MHESRDNPLANVDFGTYHHSTPEQSRELREWVEKEFRSVFQKLYHPDASLNILDAGSGLGFLSYVTATYYWQSKVMGIDLFGHNSLSVASIERAQENMKALGLESRVTFLKHDLAVSLGSASAYDLAVSNLVFHNLGMRRFKAYDTVYDALKPGGFFVLGDLFTNDRSDTEYLTTRGEQLMESSNVDSESGGPENEPLRKYRIKILRKK